MGNLSQNTFVSSNPVCLKLNTGIHKFKQCPLNLMKKFERLFSLRCPYSLFALLIIVYHLFLSWLERNDVSMQNVFTFIDLIVHVLPKNWQVCVLSFKKVKKGQTRQLDYA